MPSKDQLRKTTLAIRDLESGRETKSLAIQERLLAMPEFTQAHRILSYVGVGSEVATDLIISRGLEQGKRVAAPYVTKEGLKAAFILSRDDLAPARFGLLEPAESVRQDAARICDVREVDLFVVPGVAFDRQGGRLGHGRAYYDRLLIRARSDSHLVAVAFESQVVPEVPMTSTDVPMHALVTERELYRVGRRRADEERGINSAGNSPEDRGHAP
jgi:5-formyltetrahydrofolate cyclo-ligase